VSFFRFDHPDRLWLLMLAVPIVWLGLRSLASLERFRKWTAIALRLVVLVLIVFMLAGLQTVQRHTDLTVIGVVDESESVRRFVTPPEGANAGDNGANASSAQQWIRQYLDRATDDKRTDDKWGMVTYDGRPTVRAMPVMSIKVIPSKACRRLECISIVSLIVSSSMFSGTIAGRKTLLSLNDFGSAYVRAKAFGEHTRHLQAELLLVRTIPGRHLRLEARRRAFQTQFPDRAGMENAQRVE